MSLGAPYERLVGGNLARSSRDQQPLPSSYQRSSPQRQRSPVHLIPVTDQTQARWNHIDDLDTFFLRVYQYHQQHGFVCMMTKQTLELFQFLFVVIFTLILFNCVDYDKLFNRSGSSGKTTLSDVFLPAGQCMAHVPATFVLGLVIASIFWILRLLKVGYNFIQFREIKAFFNSALGVDDSELDNLTWYDIQLRLMVVQKEQNMCIHKTELTELDIHNRILRFKNYMIAMINKRAIPLHFRVPFLGDVVYLSKGLRYNLELLLFWGPGSPFESKWHLNSDYKRVGRRRVLASILSRRILVLGLANLLLCPLILLWQVLYSFYNYAELIKREPGSFGVRCWSGYGRFFLRHFNELDHELNARLNRGYKAASKYMSSFTTPMLEIVFKNVGFVCGAVLAVLLGLTVYDEDVLTVEHMLSLMTLLGGVVAVSRAFIADENLVFAPEQLLAAVLAHIHYMPAQWRGAAHTAPTVAEFATLFQLKAYYLLEELLSPIVTPLVLICRVRPVALQLVDFYRNFTVDVVGVGDVCSFAQLDVRRHGHPDWRAPESDDAEVEPVEVRRPAPSAAAADGAEVAEMSPAELGKTELSLMNFAINNPGWKPPPDAGAYISSLRAQGAREMSIVCEEPLPPLASVPGAHAMLIASLYGSSAHQSSLLTSMQEFPGAFPRGAETVTSRPRTSMAVHSGPEYSAVEMAISAIYMQQLHHKRVSGRRMVAGAVSTSHVRHRLLVPSPVLQRAPSPVLQRPQDLQLSVEHADSPASCIS